MLHTPDAEAKSRPLPLLLGVAEISESPTPPKYDPLEADPLKGVNRIERLPWICCRRLSPLWAFSTTQHWTLSSEEEEGQRFRSLWGKLIIVSRYGEINSTWADLWRESFETYRKLAT